MEKLNSEMEIIGLKTGEVIAFLKEKQIGMEMIFMLKKDIMK